MEIETARITFVFISFSRITHAFNLSIGQITQPNTINRKLTDMIRLTVFPICDKHTPRSMTFYYAYQIFY